MRGKLLLLAMACGIVSTAFAGGGGKNELLRRSGIKGTNNVSYPVPFDTANNARTQPAVSTGYYVMDSDDPADNFWRPDPVRKAGNLAAFTDTATVNPAFWRTIVTGPRQFQDSYWNGHPEGRPYFRNPSDLNDSVDNAFAGPIPFNFSSGFYFNGIRYDSIYISTNGLIALSNRRYFYDQGTGQRIVPQGATTAYDPNRDDTRGPQGASLNGMDDPIGDDFGYQFIALNAGNAPATGTATGGIRNPNNISLHGGNPATAVGLSGMNNNTPLIAPFWDDLQVSVYNRYTNQVDNFSKVRYYRDIDNGIFIVYFVNIMPIGGKATPTGTATFLPNSRPEGTDLGDNYCSANCQVIFNEKDGSITFVYQKFEGTAKAGSSSWPSRTIFAWNATIGVRGPARHVNYVTRTKSFGATSTYIQGTEYMFGGATIPVLRARATASQDEKVNETLNDFMAVRFKQFKNVLRVADIQYNVIPRSASGSTDYTVSIPANQVNNFELLAGHDRLGSIQPDVLIQNMTNDIQGPTGVNFTPQDLKFKARFKIFNQATGKVVYNSVQDVDSTWLAAGFVSGLSGGVRVSDRNRNPVTFPGTGSSALNGIPPYRYAHVKFSPFVTNPFLEDQIGRLRAVVIAEPISPADNSNLGEQWPFDDTTSVNLFNIRILSPTQTTAFNDDVREFHIIPLIGGAPMPSVMKWVNLEGEVVDGDEKTFNAPPPRGEFAANNIPAYKINSPVIKLNRQIIGDTEPSDGTKGDRLISFPIDLRGRKGAVLSVSYQRTGKSAISGPNADFPRGWAEGGLTGPEIRTLNGDLMPNAYNSDEAWADKLYIEFAQPSSDQINGITNIAENRYNVHPRKVGAPITGNPAFTIFGGGGYRRGFAESNKDSALTAAEGLRVSKWDDGRDNVFFKAFIPIPDTIINAPNEGARWFRFRFKIDATKNSDTPRPQDDADDFFVDNVRILFPTEVADIELSNIQVIWPYTVAPASQATQIPVRVKVANNTNVTAPSFGVQMSIMRNNDEVYDRTLTLPFLPGNREVEVPMPNWNARQGGPSTPMTGTTVSQEYTLRGKLIIPGGDIEPLNDSTFTKFNLTFGTVFAYDPANNPQNNVPDFEGSRGRGLNLTIPTAQTAIFSPGATQSFGPAGGTGSGQLAARFTLYTQDTLRGFQAFFGELNQTDDKVTFALYKDAQGTPGIRVVGLDGDDVRRGNGSIDTVVFRQGKPVIEQKPVRGIFGKYVNYMLPKEIVLAPGDYWVSVAQLGSVGFELGGSASRMGMIAGSITTSAPAPGANGNYIIIDKQLRRRVGGELQNANYFAVENTRNSNEWSQITPSTGNPVLPHLDYVGTINRGGILISRSRGSFIPMIRPYFGARSFNNAPVSVEMLAFEGHVVNKGVNLTWETASEISNSGFNVERRLVSDESNWNAITFVPANGTGNSSARQSYDYRDSKVVAGEKYEYRIRQRDVSGKEQLSRTIEVEIPVDGTIALEQNSPNPFVGQSTTIGFMVPAKEHVRLEIMDVYGNTIRTLVDDVVSGKQSVTWDGTSDAGSSVANGSYMYRLTVGERSETRKLTLLR